jgi:hypothetical protein
VSGAAVGSFGREKLSSPVSKAVVGFGVGIKALNPNDGVIDSFISKLGEAKYKQAFVAF